MFRRSFQILLVATLLALAAIVGYASLRLGSPTERLAEAEQMVRRQEYRRAIKVLDLYEGGLSLQRDADLRERLWRLRLEAYAALGNHRGALLDIDNLLRDHGDGDLDLQLERIRLLTAVGEGTQARQLARHFVAAHPEHARGLELAGAACEEAYRAEWTRLQATIERDVGTGRTSAAQTAFATYVFRPDGDAEVAASGNALEAMYAVDVRLAAQWQTLLRELRALRDAVQEGLGYCRRSLELPGTPSTALVTWANALEAGGRTDDMLLACEIQRRRTDDVAAGLVAARTLLQNGANAAAIATTGRWLPQPQIQARIDAGRLGDGAPDLLLAGVLASWRLGETASLHRTLAAVQLLHRNDIKAPIPLHTAAGMLHYLNQATKDSELDRKNAENNLRYVTLLLQREPARPGWPDLLDIILPLRLDLLPKLGSSEAEVLDVYNAWQEARPGALAPRLAFVRHLLARQKWQTAAAVLAETSEAHPTDERVFDLRLQLARADTSQAGQDGMSLLAQCQKRRSGVPEVAQPIGYMLCAEAALQHKAWIVARESSRLAVDAFPQMRAPRLLAIEATLRSGQAELAAQQIRRHMELFAVDEATALLALRAHGAAALPTTDLLPQVLPACPPGTVVRTELLRAALAADPATAEKFAVPVITDTAAPATLRLLAARALGLAGRTVDCRRLLESVIAEVDALPITARLDLAEAIVAWIGSASRPRDDASLSPDVARMLARTDLRDLAAAPLLLRLATELADSHPRAAYELLTRGVSIGDAATRTGSVFALAGRLAIRLRQLRLAEEHWLAALAFADGHGAAEDLARLLLAQSRVERAIQVYGLTTKATATDAALAARCGAKERALALASAAATADAADLLAQATLAVLGQRTTADWQPVDVPASELRLDLLALLHNGDLAPEALALARALAAADPASTTTQLLLARACLQAGEADEAAGIHRALRTRAPGPLLWREVALAAQVTGYPLDAQLATDLVGAVVNGAIAGSPETLVWGTRRMVASLQQAGHAETAAATRAGLWLHLPRATVQTDADVEAVATMASPRDAWYVLDLRLPDLTGATRALARTRLYERADQLVRERGRAATDVYEAARRHVVSEGPYGCLVHFLLDHGSTFPGLQPEPKVALSLLLAQIELAGSGRDPGPWLARSVERLLAAQGAEATRRDVEAALRRHPTSLPLWHARATVMARTQAGADGIHDLRRVLAHAVAPDDTLPFLVLAGATGALQDADHDLLAGLPPPLLATAEGGFARGLLALRAGKPDDAVPLLAEAPARADGLHLFVLALANLQSRAVEGATRARDALQRLAADYPSSSLARHAGSFAAQLAPR